MSEIREKLLAGLPIVARGDHLTCDLDGDAVLLHLQSGVYFGLEGTATRIWELIREPRRYSDICAKLAEEFEALPEAWEESTLDFLGDLLEQELAEFHGESG